MSDWTPAVGPKRFVNDWIKRKYKQESKRILENHQVSFSGTGPGEDRNRNILMM